LYIILYYVIINFMERLASAEPLTDFSVAERLNYQNDLSALTPRQLADYHFAVTALQLDGREIFLSAHAQDAANRIVDGTHHNLLVASGDALTKELLPGAMGFSAGHRESDRDSVATASHPDILERYAVYMPVTLPGGPRMGYVGTENTRLIYGMRNALEAHASNLAAVTTIVSDLADISQELFADIQKEQMEAGANSKVAGWLQFATNLRAFTHALRTGDWNMTTVTASMVINSAHGGGPIVERFTDVRQHGDKAKAYRAVLEASMGTYDELLPHASYEGGILYMYLTGKRKSLSGLPGGKAVPASFGWS
jgi:hypothetical protein